MVALGEAAVLGEAVTLSLFRTFERNMSSHLPFASAVECLGEDTNLGAGCESRWYLHLAGKFAVLGGFQIDLASEIRAVIAGRIAEGNHGGRINGLPVARPPVRSGRSACRPLRVDFDFVLHPHSSLEGPSG
jgi:hypothetical protein